MTATARHLYALALLVGLMAVAVDDGRARGWIYALILALAAYLVDLRNEDR